MDEKSERVFNGIKTKCLWGISVDPDKTTTLCNYEDELNAAKEKQTGTGSKQIVILQELEKYYAEVMHKYGNTAP